MPVCFCRASKELGLHGQLPRRHRRRLSAQPAEQAQERRLCKQLLCAFSEGFPPGARLTLMSGGTSSLTRVSRSGSGKAPGRREAGGGERRPPLKVTCCRGVPVPPALSWGGQRESGLRTGPPLRGPLDSCESSPGEWRRVCEFPHHGARSRVRESPSHTEGSVPDFKERAAYLSKQIHVPDCDRPVSF